MPSLPKTGSPKQLAEQTGPGALLLDFDGTLAVFRRDPQAVVLSGRMRNALARVSRTRFVALISGRPLAYLRRVTRGLDLLLIGSHGAESSEPLLCIRPRVSLSPEVDQKLRLALRQGLRVERKPFGRVVHFRSLPPAARLAKQTEWEEQMLALAPRGWEVMRGNAVVELRPAGIDKGSVIKPLRRFTNAHIAAALGDDITDEDMFRALYSDELSILVGACRPTLARAHLPGVGAVAAYLAAL